MFWLRQVNKMGGEIKVVKKNSPGTLMQLYLLLGASEAEQIYDADFPNTVVSNYIVWNIKHVT